MAATVRDVPDRSRYEIVLDGTPVGFADYQLHDDIRAHGRTVAPVCSYVARFLEAHPDDGDLLAG